MNSSNNTSECLTSPGRRAELYSYPLPIRSTTELTLEIVIGCVLFILGITGNGLVCYVISRSPRTRSSMYFLLVQLAVADILVCLVSIPLTLVSTQPIPFLLLQSDISCKMVRFIQYLLLPASVNLLTVTAVDRFFQICYPLKFFNRDSKIKCLAVCSWIYAAILTLPEFYFISTRLVKHGEKVYVFCAVKETSKDAKLGTIYLAVRGILGFLTPLAIIITLYYKIIKTVWSRQTIRSRMRRNVIKSLAMVVIAFFLSWSPFSIISKHSILMQERYNSVSRAEIITFWIGLSASVYNPLIYAFYNKNFRDAFREVVLHRKTTKKMAFNIQSQVKLVKKPEKETETFGLQSETPILLKYSELTNLQNQRTENSHNL